ncbi:glycosyltransferase family 2 protein [Rhabdaerophilum calidifontis]|uniref:glycosyltransferase family 2 protein n=1 Tax=Rhabdaerophilum calidifontis TaxID=2604328 RepID=UPI001238CFFD|nr:glycosyltransferase family 2 protein [Rhabdaerophilum calidifontis]
MTPLPLSIFLIARNESDRLPRTLRAVRGLAAELIVVDSGSTDDTVARAEAEGARVVFNAWSGYGPQKRFAETQCRERWLLNLDADEWVPPELAAEIRALFAHGEPAADAYEIRIAEVFPGEAAPHRFAYALAPVRLYRRDRGSYSASPVHDRVDLQPGARVARLRGVIHHFSVRSIGDQIGKLNAYSDQQVADLAARGKTIPVWRVFVEFPAAFLKAYLLRRHAMRGVYGFITAMNYAFFRWLRVAKAYEQRRRAAQAARRPGDGA